MPELPRDQTGRRLDWYDATGTLRGHVELPVQLSTRPIPVVHDGRLYGVERDDLDVPYVVVLRLRQN